MWGSDTSWTWCLQTLKPQKNSVSLDLVVVLLGLANWFDLVLYLNIFKKQNEEKIKLHVVCDTAGLSAYNAHLCYLWISDSSPEVN